MSKEIEIKILDIDVPTVQKKLSYLGAIFKGEVLQKIYTYDLFPISTTFISIIETLRKKIGQKETELAKHKLHSLLIDLSDLLSEEDKKSIFNLTGSDLDNIAKQVLESHIPTIFFDKVFVDIVSHYDTNPNKWVRLRESNGIVKIALKQIYNRKIVNGIRQHAINDVKEIEIQIDSIDKGKLFLEELGYFHKNYQEKKRISYILSENTHIDIDMWPHIPPYIEIEADNEIIVYETLEKLGYKKEDAKILNADDVFIFYGLDMYSYKELKFK